MYKLYWIRTLEMKDPYSEGYIGITKRNIQDRLNEHMNRHNHINEECIIDLLHKGNKEEISRLERKYRPKSWIGWNKSPGGLTGGRPNNIHTSGWKHSKESREKRSQMFSGENNPMYGRTLTDEHKAAIAKANKIPKPHLSKLYKERSKNGTGNLPIMKGADNPRSQKVYAEGVIYETVTACTKAYGFMSYNSVAYRCKNTKEKWSEWYYI